MHRVLVVLSLLAACPGGGGPARKIEPPVPTVGTADPGMKPPSIEACKEPASHDLMVIDWTPELRGDLEVAMKQGIALLAYDCKSVKLVTACTIEGSYGFIGTTKREKKIELSDAEEVAANLPVGGLSWLSDVGGKLARDRALLAQLVMIGKRSAGKRIAPDELAGCKGATHYVRAATVGAFAVAAGSKAEISGGLTLMGKGAKGSSTSSTKIQASDGDIEACEKSTPESTTPPAQCGAVVRVEIDPVTIAATSELAVPTCAAGFAMSDGRCVKLSKPHQCKPGDAQDCAKQCDAGDTGSCATLAVMHRDGTGAAKDPAKAAALGKRACDADVTTGCRVAAATQLAKDRGGALKLLVRACEAGDGKGCVELGIAQLGDKATAEKAQYSFRRACYGGGEVEGCAWLGSMYVDGKGGLSNPKIGAQFLEKGCKDGSGRACHLLAELTNGGKGVAKNPAKAKELSAKACKLGHAAACR